jgi:hypothetical protein
MLNNLGEQSEGVIQRGYKMTTALVENYETVGKVIVSLVATYGAYRAAVALNTVAESGWTIAQMAQYRVLLLVERAQRMLNAAMLTNPFVLAATAVVALAGAMWVLRDSTSASEKALAEYNKKREEAKRVEDEHKSRIESLINTVNDEAAATYQRIMAMKDLQKEYLDIFKDYDIEALKLADILKIKKQIAKVEGRKSLTSKEDEAAELRKQIETAKYEAKHDASRDRRLTSARRAARLERQLQLIEKDINAQKQAMWEANTPLSVKQEGLRGNIAALKEENKLLDEKISKQNERNRSRPIRSNIRTT